MVRCFAEVHPERAKALHLVELSLARLGGRGQGKAPRPCMGQPAARRRGESDQGFSRRAWMGAALRPCAGKGGFVAVTLARSGRGDLHEVQTGSGGNHGLSAHQGRTEAHCCARRARGSRHRVSLLPRDARLFRPCSARWSFRRRPRMARRLRHSPHLRQRHERCGARARLPARQRAALSDGDVALDRSGPHRRDRRPRHGRRRQVLAHPWIISPCGVRALRRCRPRRRRGCKPMPTASTPSSTLTRTHCRSNSCCSAPTPSTGSPQTRWCGSS